MGISAHENPPVVRFPTTVESIAGQSVSQLARQFGTPLFVYDAGAITERLARLASFDVVRYAQKACSNLALIDLVRRHGGLVDTVSAGEIRRALAAGYTAGDRDPPPIAYTADLFDRESLDLIFEHGIAVNCGSPDMIDQYGRRCRDHGGPRREITLRINPGFGHGHSQKTNTGGPQSKHGIWHESLDAALKRARAYDLTVTGLHMHIGSGTDMRHLGKVAAAMRDLAFRVGESIDSISAGGGLSTPYQNDDRIVDVEGYYRLWNRVRQGLESQFGHRISLEIEPGRYLVAESGSLVTEIRAVKRMGENLFYLVDAGFNNLARPILYGAYHPMAICHTDQGSPARAGKTEAELQPVVIGGPLCESGDIFTQEEGGLVSHRQLPSAAVGDLLVIGCTGAYGSVMGSNYNSKPMAAEVLIDGGHARMIRRRQTFEEMIQAERIPGL